QRWPQAPQLAGSVMVSPQPQGPHEPPQSTSVSSPSLTPSLQCPGVPPVPPLPPVPPVAPVPPVPLALVEPPAALPVVVVPAGPVGSTRICPHDETMAIARGNARCARLVAWLTRRMVPRPCPGMIAPDERRPYPHRPRSPRCPRRRDGATHGA